MKNDKILKNDFLDDNFQITRNREPGLRSLIQEVTDRTIFEEIAPSRLEVYSLLDKSLGNGFEIIKIIPDFANIWMLTPQNMEQVYFKPGNHNIGRISKNKFRKMGMTETQITEIEKAGYFFQYTKDNGKKTIIIPYKGLLSELCRKLGVGKLVDGICPLRDIFLASLMKNADNFILVQRKGSSYTKAFTCFSSNTEHTDQSVIFDLKDKLAEFGLITIRHFKLTHAKTTIDYAFNDMSTRILNTKITPGVRLCLSDIGDSSFTLQNTLYVNGGAALFTEAVAKRNRSIVNVEEIIKKYKKEVYPKLSEQMKFLTGLCEKHVSDLDSKIERLMKITGMKQVMGRNNYRHFSDNLMPEIPNKGTAVEAAIWILKLPGLTRPHYKDYINEQISVCAGKIFSKEGKRVF